MRVLVCGGRDFTDDDLLYEKLNEVHGSFNLEHNISCIIHGAARGADTLAHQWAWEFEVETDYYPAGWQLFGPAAGVIRNKRMLSHGKPDLVIAFPGGKGTANMIQLAEEAGVKVIKVDAGSL